MAIEVPKKHQTARKKVAQHALAHRGKAAQVAPPPVRTKRSSVTPLGLKIRRAIGYLLVTALCFYGAEIIVNLALGLAISWLHIPLLMVMSSAVLQSVASVVIYALAFVMTVYVIRLLFKKPTTAETVGLKQRLPRWRDIGLAPLVFIGYMVVSAIFVQFISAVLPNLIDANQHQAIGFSDVTTRYELMAAFITLVVLAPFAEELLFRGLLFGKLRTFLSMGATVLLTAVLFASLHLIGIKDDGQIQLQWAVVCDTFVLALALGLLREKTGSIWAGILLHMIKNSIAFFILFIAPLLNIAIPGM